MWESRHLAAGLKGFWAAPTRVYMPVLWARWGWQPASLIDNPGADQIGRAALTETNRRWNTTIWMSSLGVWGAGEVNDGAAGVNEGRSPGAERGGSSGRERKLLDGRRAGPSGSAAGGRWSWLKPCPYYCSHCGREELQRPGAPTSPP